MAREGNPKVECAEMQRLVPSYLDEELSEAQAALLRAHLMDCTCCRASVQDLKSLRRWFVATPASEVPPGFAERVARRAFAGDTGEREHVFAGPGNAQQSREFRFVLHLTAVAAGVLFVLGMALRERDLPSTGRGLQADELRSLESVRQDLEELNQRETEAAAQLLTGSESKDRREGQDP